jgi:hypothetical protein
MANNITLTGFTELLYEARDIVAAEPCALANSVMINSNGIERVSLNGTVKSYRTSKPTLNTSYTPAMTPPDGDDQTITTDTLTIGQVANVKIPFKGEVMRQLENTSGRKAVVDDMFAQAFRTIRNAIEAHLGTVIYKGASRATGTAGTTPFASNHNSVNALRQILVDNGCPQDGQISLVLNTLAGTNVRNLSNLYKVNESGSQELLRRGILQDISGIMLKESAGIASVTKGTGASYVTSGSTAIGVTDIALVTGTGTVLAGDVVTFAADATNKYVVGTGVAAPGTISLNQTGAQVVIATANAMTIGANYAANVGFHKNAVELVMRPPAMPEGGDSAADRTTIVDEKTGLVFEVALYKGYGMNMVDITTFYQAKVWKPEFVATLLG